MTHYHQILPEAATMQKEPVLTGATVLSLVTAIIGLLTAFGVDITADQKAAILTVVGIVAPIVVGLVVRSKVSPTP